MRGDDRDDLALGERALRLAVATLPHLAGLAREVRLAPDRRVNVAAVFASGRLLFNPTTFGGLSAADGAFVMAHELLHLALRTHRRGEGSDPLAVNFAHDYIINDMLTEAFRRPVPAGGLDWPGAREHSLEHILGMMHDGRLGPSRCWGNAPGWPPARGGKDLDGGLKRERRDRSNRPSGGAGAPPPEGQQGAAADHPARGDVLPPELERQWFPDVAPADQLGAQERVEVAAARSASLGELADQLARSHPGGWVGAVPPAEVFRDALRGYYHTPWEAALQKWLEASAPGVRSYARPSRRGGDRTDVVLPGRVRTGWTMHMILDTSGSMNVKLPRALGMIASFCENVGVEQVHVIQCDTEIRADEWVEVGQLATYRILGLGDDDKRPAMLRLAADPEVQAAMVLTDHDVTWYAYPPEPMPYDVLWVLMEPVPEWSPPYGEKIELPYVDYYGG